MTTYVVLRRDDSRPDVDHVIWIDTLGRVEARAPEQAVEKFNPGDASHCVAIPESSWHVFEKATAWKKKTDARR